MCVHRFRFMVQFRWKVLYFLVEIGLYDTANGQIPPTEEIAPSYSLTESVSHNSISIVQ